MVNYFCCVCPFISGFSLKKTNNNKKTNPVFPTSLILITFSKFPLCNTYLFQEGKTSSHPIFFFFFFASFSTFYFFRKHWLLKILCCCCSLSHVRLFAAPWIAEHLASLSFTISQICSISYPLIGWCQPIISSSVVLFSCPQHLPASRSFPMHLLFASGGQSIGVLVSVLPWILRVDFLQDWLVWSPSYPRDTEETFPTPISKASILQCSDFFIVQLSHPYMTTGKNIALTRWTFVGKVMSLLFNMLSGLSLLLPRSKHLLISWLQS